MIVLLRWVYNFPCCLYTLPINIVNRLDCRIDSSGTILSQWVDSETYVKSSAGFLLHAIYQKNVLLSLGAFGTIWEMLKYNLRMVNTWSRWDWYSGYQLHQGVLGTNLRVDWTDAMALQGHPQAFETHHTWYRTTSDNLRRTLKCRGLTWENSRMQATR